ncbi:hypothetical protein C8J56DRAFT_1014096 [Mycena floridula]|nr:hypothetical protein C8J56DRAFT_1014096 [Mycena floridula]
MPSSILDMSLGFFKALFEKRPVGFCLATIAVLLALHRQFARPRRPFKLSKVGERVLVIGATSGIGKDIALQYATRGARLCVVGRRSDLVKTVAESCQALANDATNVTGITADFSSVDDMVRVRETLGKEWNGLDTLLVCAGELTSAEGIKRAIKISDEAYKSNVSGPLITALCLIPFMTVTSKSPSILLVSSVGAIIPAPTRALYGSSKAASLGLYQALAIEHPSISWSFVLPATVEGNFRASAVDKGPVREADPNTHGLKSAAVARRCIQAVDYSEKMVLMPRFIYGFAYAVYWFYPPIIEALARQKYRYP